jgi:hypothetical protein
MKKEKKHRLYRSRQGRSDRQYTNSYIAFAISLFGLIITILIAKFY